jgi:hypothetical protein
MKLQPGQKVVVIEKDGVVHLIPLKSLKDMRGVAKGAKVGIIREETDRVQS